MIYRVGLLLGTVAPTADGLAQTHKVAKPETVVRAVSVYEWTGDLAKPAASRVIPITLFIDRHLEDAGLYLARPVPLALQSGNIYELEQAGVPKGTVELVYARHLQAATAAEAYDDGWFGYGSFKSLPIPKKPIARKPSTQLAKVESSGSDAGKPRFGGKTGDSAASPAPSDPAKPSDAKPDDAKAADTKDASADPDRPTMKRRNTDDPPSATADTNAKTPAAADDPDRPTMKRRTDAASDTTATNGSAASAPAADDPDRPTLKRHSAEDARKAAKEKTEASVTGAAGSLNDDPDRPNLHRGKPTRAMTETDLPKLSGLPVNTQQMIAISDAANRPVHDFTRAWEDDAERAAVLGKMQAIAQAQLAAYGVPAATVAAKPQSVSAHRPDSKRRGLAPVRVGQSDLLEEKLNGYLLSYGDAPTFVYQAHTTGTGADLRYVTIVAQRDAQGEPAVAMRSLTDAAHLDRTARMRLVDAVDVEASNRASLLFEMRGQTSRQFGVYRVLGQHAEQIFSTGTTQ